MKGHGEQAERRAQNEVGPRRIGIEVFGAPKEVVESQGSARNSEGHTPKENPEEQHEMTAAQVKKKQVYGEEGTQQTVYALDSLHFIWLFSVAITRAIRMPSIAADTIPPA